MSEKIYTFQSIEPQQNTQEAEINTPPKEGKTIDNLVKLNMLRDLISQDIQKQLDERDAKVDEWAKIVLYTYAKPQIRGDITKGKLKWRGIKMVAIHNDFGEHTTVYTIMQRGVLLGKFEVSLI